MVKKYIVGKRVAHLPLGVCTLRVFVHNGSEKTERLEGEVTEKVVDDGNGGKRTEKHFITGGKDFAPNTRVNLV